MTSEEIDKSLRQIRKVFIAAGIINLIVFCILTVTSLSNFTEENPTLSTFFCVVPLVLIETVCLWTAAYGIKKRSSNGYIFALISSILFIASFPVYTIFGIIYLRKLLKPEVKQMFVQPNRLTQTIAISITVLVAGFPLVLGLLVLFLKAIDLTGLWCNLFPFIAGC